MRFYCLFVETSDSWTPLGKFMSSAAALAEAQRLGLSVFRIETL